MVSKNNVQERQRKDSDQKPHYAIKKLTIGVVSVLVGTTFAAYNSQVSADTTASPANLTAQTNDVTPTGNSLTAGTATAGDDNASAAASPASQSTATASNSSGASAGESQSGTPTSQTTSSTTPASTVPTADSAASGDTTTESAVSRRLTISVSYEGAANNPLQETRQLTFNGIQHQTTSDGTTTTTYTWQQNHASLQTTTPVVEGYAADASAVDQEVSLDEQGNLVVEVNGQKHLLSALNPNFNTDVKYQKVGKVIPVAEDGTVIQTDANGAYVDSQAYQNDAADATKVTYTVPTIAGYITMQASDEGIHTPNSATDDTKIYYVPLKSTKTVTRTITYSGAGTHTSANATYSIVFTQTNARDEQTGGLTRTWDKERDSWPSVIVPAIDGYTPNVTEIAADDNVTYQTADQNISVIYSPNQQNGQVDFIDCDDQNQTIKTVAISGVSEGQIDFTTAATALSDLEQAGYALAATNDWVDADGTFKTAEFDTDDNITQTFEVYLVHQQATTTTDKTITRKITYTGAKDNPESVSQTAVFTETIVKDLQNGKTLQDTWKLKNNGFTAVDTPTIKGYTPNLKTIAAKDDSSISHTDSDQTIEVVYTPDDQKATVAFYVDQQNVYSLPLLGKTDQKIDLTAAQTMLNNFEQAGYTVLDGDLNADYTYDDEDDQDQTITVKLQQPTTSKTVHLTVNYSGAGDAIPAAAERDIVFIGTISYDPATSTTKTDWTPQMTDAAVIATPVVDGFIASQAQIIASPDQENQTATVSYAKIGILQAVDEAGNVLATINYQNDPNDATKVGQTALPAVSGYVPKDGQQFITPTDTIRDIQVVYLPIKAQFTQTITFTGAGAKTPTPQTQTIALTDSQTSGTFTFVVPKLAGYDVQITGATQTVDQSNNILVTGATIVADSSNPAPITVTYTARQQTGEVLFVDDTDQGKQLATAELTGITDQSIDFSQAADQLAAYLKAGYALSATGNDCLDENGSFKAAVYGENNNFTVHLIHQTAVINSAADAQKLVLPSGVSLSAADQQALLSENSYLDTTTASRVVKYAFSSNDATSQVPTATDQTQTVTFNRTNSYTVDLATGAVTKNNGDWQIAATPASDGSARLDAITPLTFAGWYLAISAVTDSLDAAATADDILKAHAVKPGQTQTLTLTYQKLAAATISILDEGINSGQSDKASLLNTYTVKGQQGADIDCDQVTEIVSVTTKDPDGKENTVTAESAANANAQLNAYLKAGYQLDQSLAAIQDDNGTTTYTFKNGAVVTEKDGVYSFANQYDADDATVQNYQVYLVHGTTTATKNKTITRTIYLHNVDQTTTKTVQSCALTETIITDNVTGDTVSDTWNSGAWEAFEIPAVDGYVASENDLAKTSVYNTTSDQVVNVIYVPNSATATIKIIDDDAGNAELNEYQVSGTTAGQVNFNQAITQLKKYLTGNYTFNTANKNNSAKFTIAYRNGKLDSLSAADIYGATAQEYEIHLQHQKSISKEYADMTRTINLELPSGTKIVTQTVQISRAATTDLVTGSRSYGDWTITAAWPEYAVPAVPGYQASRDVIVSETVTNTTPDKSINVVYTPIVQHANITIIDDTQNTTLAQADLTGTYGQAVDFDKPAISLDNVSPNGKLQEFIKNGYVLASQDNVASDNQHFATTVYGLEPLSITVHLKEGTQATEETKKLTRTINYIVNGNVFKTVSQSAVLKRTKTVNLVTGATTYSEWTTGQWDKAVSPTHETDPTHIPDGYYPDKEIVSEQTVLHATGNQIVLVYYSRPSNYRSATINIIDEEDDGKVTLWTQETAGETGDPVDFTSANAALSDYLNQGFVADSNRSLEHQAVNDDLKTFAQRTFADDSTQNVFTVYLKHGTQNLGDEKREVTRTINYVFPDGTTRTYVQAVDFKRTVTEDLVDERNIYGDWTFDSSQTTLSTTANGKTTDSKLSNVNQVAAFGKLDTAQVAKDAKQDITGYVPSQAVVDELSGITEQTASQVVNITFSPKVESAVIGMIDTTVAADPKTGANDFDFQSIYTNTASGYFGKSINVDLVNQYLNQFLNQNGYRLGVDTQTGTAKLINDTTTDNTDNSQTETLTYTYTAGNTTAGQITETITTEPATVDNDGNTITVKHYHFVMDSVASDVTATTTTTAAGNSSTVYQLDVKPFLDSMQTLVVPMLHYRTTANYSTSNPPAGTYKDVVRTIIYHLPDGTTETKTQIVRFTRSITTDHVTGMQTASSWSTGNDNYAWIETQLPDQPTTQSEVTRSSIWSSQSTPIVKGYTPTTPTQKVVAVTAATPDSVIEISYQADKQAATIQIIDSTTGDVLSNYNVHGVTNEAINFDDANAQLNYYLTHGYLLANDTADHHNNDVQISDGQTSFKAVNYDNEDAQDQAFKVYLIHDEAKTDQAVDPNLTSITDTSGKQIDYVDNVKSNPKVTNPASYVQTVTSKRTAKFVFDGDSTTKPNISDCVQTVTWTRTVSYTIDLVTGKETPTYGEWKFVASTPNGKQVQTAVNGGQAETTATTVTADEQEAGYVAAVSGSFAGWYQVNSDSATGKQTLPALANGQGLNQTVILEYKEYAKARIQIIDANPTENQGTLYDETKADGQYKQGTSIDFKDANAKLAELLSHGYVFDHASTNGNGTAVGTADGFAADTYDAKDNEDQNFIIYLRHDTAQATTQLTNDSRLTAASGRTAYLDSALKNTTLTNVDSYQESATSTRTVTFAFTSNTALPSAIAKVNGQTVTQVVTYTRPISYTIDLVTGTATRDYQTWQIDPKVMGTTSQGTTTTIDQNGQTTLSAAANFNDGIFPTVSGQIDGWYLASGDASAAQAPSPRTDQVGANVASSITLTFKKLQNAYIKIVDDNETDNQGTLYDESTSDANSKNVAQKQGTAIDFTNAQAKLNDLLKSGYVVDTEKTSALTVSTFTATNFDSDDTGDQMITVYLKHGTAIIGVNTDTNTSQATVGGLINPGSKNTAGWPDAVKYRNLTRQATQTIEYLYQGGGQAHESNVQTVVLTRTVTIDKVTGKVIKYSNFTTQKFADVISPTIDNYRYVNSDDRVVVGKTASATFDEKGNETDSNLDVTYQVKYKTNGTWKKINEPVYDQDGQVRYRTDATGTSYLTEADDASTVTATVPTYQGYTAVFETNQDSKTDQTLTPNKQTSSQNQVIKLQNDQAGQDSTVTYTPDPQQIVYRIYDQTLSKYISVADGDQLKKDATTGLLVVGVSDASAEYLDTNPSQTTAAKYQALKDDLVNRGYKLVSADSLPAFFDHDDDNNQTVTITVVHDYAEFKDAQTALNAENNGTVTDTAGQQAVYLWKNSDYSKRSYTDTTTATRTIKFQFNGNAQSKPQVDDVTQTVSYQRPIVYTIDLVDGTITRDHAAWKFASAKTGPTKITMDSDGKITTEGANDNLGNATMPAVTGSFAGWYLYLNDGSGVPVLNANDDAFLQPDTSKEGQAANQSTTVMLTYLHYQKATIQIIDDDQNDKQTLVNGYLTTGDGNLYTQVDLEGQQGAEIDFTAANALLEKLLAAGYQYEAGMDKFAQANFDNDDTVDQNFVVKLIHESITLDGKNQDQLPTVGNEISPGSLSQATWPEDVNSSNLTRQAERSIIYQYADGSSADNEQVKDVHDQAVLTRTVTIDKVTGKVLKTGEFSTHVFEDKQNPVIAGYHTKNPSTAGFTAKAENNLKNETTVYYYANGKYLDQRNGQQTAYTTGKDNAAISGTISVDPGYTAHIEQKQGTIDVPNSGTELITYTFTPDDPANDTTVTYTANPQTAIVQIIDDDANGKILNADAQNTDGQTLTGTSDAMIDFSSINTELADLIKHGYLLNKASQANSANVDSEKVEFEDANYDHNDKATQVFTIHLIHDQADISEKPNYGHTIKDQAGQSVLYQPVKDNLADKAFSESSTAKRTISYTFIGDANSKPNAAGIVQTINFKRGLTYTVDLVTGKILATASGEWEFESGISGDTKLTDATIPAVSSEFAGWYLVKSDNTEAKKLVPGAAEEIGSLQFKHYQKATVQIIDDMTNNTLFTQSFANQKQDDQVDFSNANDKLGNLLTAGYILDSAKLSNGTADGFTPAVYDSLDNTDQTFTIYLTHVKIEITVDSAKTVGAKINQKGDAVWPAEAGKDYLTKTVSQTINYVTSDGQSLAKSVVQTSTLTRTVTIDCVTGKKITETEFIDPATHENGHTFDKIQTPFVEGYHVHDGSQEAGGLTATAEAPDREMTVTYYANGYVKAVDSTGKLFKDYQPVQYTTVKDDISKVQNITIPTYAGYTAKINGQTVVQGSTYVIGDPDEDTVIVYTADAQKAQVQIFDDNDDNVDPKTPLWTSAPDDLNGYTDALIDFSSSQKQLDYYLSHGYQLAANGNNDLDGKRFKTAYYDNVDDAEQTFVVHLVHRLETVGVTDPYQTGKKIYADADVTWPALTLTKDASRTIHYQGIDGQNPVDHVDQVTAAFTRTATIDLATGTVASYSEFTGQKIFEKDVLTPAMPGYHVAENDRLAGGLTATLNEPSPKMAVTYLPNGSLRFTDQSQTLSSAQLQSIQYTTDAKDPSKVTVTIPLYSGYTAKIGDQIITSTNNQREMTATTGAGSDMEVVYTADAQKAQVQIFDDDAKDSALPIWQTELSGTTAGTIEFTAGNDQLKYYLNHGYQLAANGNGDLDGTQFKSAVYDNVDDVEQTFVAHLVHGKRTFNFGDSQPTGKMYSDVENSPAWPTMTLSEDATQTIKYAGAGTDTPGNKMQTAKDAFKRTATVDLVTGKVEYSAFSGNNVTFNPETTDVVPGYHVAENAKTVDGLTATAEKPNRDTTVTYLPNGSLRFTDQSQTLSSAQLQSIQYTTDANDPRRVTVTIPLYSGYTAKIGDQIITSTNNQREMTATTGAGSDMEVVYTANAQKAQVQIFDDDVDSKTLLWTSASDDLNGYTDALIDFSSSQKHLDYYLSHGYQLAANGNNDLDGKRFKIAYYDNVDGVDQTFVVHLVHGKRTFNFGDSQPTGKMYSDEKSPVWPTMTLSEDATQTIKYTGAATDTPGNKTQTAKDAFTRTATVDLVTGKVEYSAFSGNNVKFNPETTDVVAGYHVAETANTAGGLTATPIEPNLEMAVTYLPNGSLRFTDQSQTLSSAQLQSIQYTTDAKYPSIVTVTIPLYSGYTAKIGDQIITSANNQREMTATTGAGSDMEVVYTADAQKAQVQIFDDDAKDSALPIWQTELSGTTAGKIEFTAGNDQLKYYLNHGYQLAANGNNNLDGTQFKTAYYDNVDDVDQTFVVHLVHRLKTVGVTDSYQAGQKIYANTDVTWPALTLTKDASQTIHYQGIDGQNPADHVDQAADVFTRTAMIDLVTGTVTSYSKFTGQQTFEKNVATPVVPGYHVDENDRLAGGLTATPDDPNPDTTVTYLPNGFLKALDASGQAMKGFVPVQYTTYQTNPSQVTVIIPTFAGYTATINGAAVDQGIQYQIVNADRDTEVVYTANPQKLTVEFIDQTDHHDLAKVDLTGKTEQAVDFSEAAKKLSAYLTKYVLSDNNPGLDQGKFKVVAYDAVDTQDQIIKVYLEHGHETVTESKAVTENITYVYQNADQQIAFKNAKQKKQAVRTGIRDLATNQIVWSDKIEPIIFNSVDSPLLIGYQAQIKQVPVTNVTVTNDNWATDLDQNIKVVYEPIAQTAIVSFVDQDDLKQTFPTITINGLSDQLIDFKAVQAQLQNYLTAGYVLASDTDLADAKFDRTDDPQFFTIYLKHGQQPDQRTKQVTETIKYVYADQTQAALPVVETITATQSGIKDLVTQQTDWNGKITFSADFTAVTSPLIEGYTPDQAVIEPSHPDDPDWNQLDIIKIVTYAADPQKLTFTIFDRTANTNLSMPNDLLTSIGISDHVLATGTSDAKLNQAAVARYQQLIKTVTEYFAAQAYGDVQSEQLPAMFDHDDTTDQNVVISLAHETGTVSHMVDQQKPTDDQGHQLPDSLDPLLYKEESFWDYPTSTRKISYNFQTNDATNVPQVQQAVQTVTYRRTVSYTVDLVTGQLVGEPIYGEPAYYASSTTAVFAKQDYDSDAVQTSGANDSLGTNQIPGVTGEFNGWYEELADNNGTETVLFDGSRWYVEVAGQKQFVPANQLGKIVFKRYQKARTEIIDDDDNGKQLFIEDLIGKQQAAVDFQTAAAKLDELLSDGYQLANQAAAAPVSSKLLQRFGLMLFASLRVKTSSMGQKAFGSAAYDTDDTNVQVFTVHVTHQKETRQEAKTITRTINYHQPDGTVITVTQPATITRTVLFDKVTKQATPTTAWTMTAHAEQATPKINGYTPDKTKVDVASVDGTSQNSSVDVVYYRDKQKAIIDFVDDDRGQTLSTVTVDGKLNDSIDFSLANQALESYRNHGYQLAFSGNDDLNDAQTVFKAAKYHAVNGVQNYVVHLTHVWQDATEDKTIIRTINYHLPDGTLKTITQPATINRSVKIDKAVGTKICGKWSQASWPAIEVPSLAGYSPSQAAIVAETVDGATADKTVDVFYQGHEQAASVRIIDLTTGKPLTEEKLHGLSGEPLDFAKINAELTAYLSAGYTLASNNQAIDDLAMKSADFDSDDQSDQVFVVYLTHRINEVPETQTVTRVIKYRQPDGSVKTVQETQLSKRLLRIDAVTGQKVASGDWTPISWPEIVPPTFKGYTATVSQNIPQNDGTVLVEVSYQAELNDDHNLEQDDHNQDADKHNSQTIHQLDQSDSHSVDSAAVSPSIPRTDKPAGMANKPTGKQTDHSNNQRLVQTGNQGTGKQTVLGGLLLGLAGMLSGLGLKRKKRGDK